MHGQMRPSPEHIADLRRAFDENARSPVTAATASTGSGTLCHGCSSAAKQLLNAGIITREKRGSYAYFSLADGALERVAGLLSARNGSAAAA